MQMMALFILRKQLFAFKGINFGLFNLMLTSCNTKLLMLKLILNSRKVPLLQFTIHTNNFAEKQIIIQLIL